MVLVLLNISLLVLSIILHEISHGFVANLYGDDTAKRSGRLTLNPVSHIDPVGTILIPLMLFISNAGVLFGWAKPVPINPDRMRNPRKDMMFVAMAGPLTNYTLAAIFSVMLKWGIFPGAHTVLISTIYVNLILGTFNLIPIPPLDGSRIAAYFLKGQTAYYYGQLENYGILLIFGLLYLGFFDFVLTALNPFFRLFLQ